MARSPNLAPTISTSPPIPGPIIGVVDGSDASPGQVGEFMTATGTFNYAAGTVGTGLSLGTIPLINMPPGDWDFTVSASFSTVITSGAFFLSPVPTGMSNEMEGLNGNFTTSTMETAVIIGQSARGSFSVTTLLTFEVEVYQGVPTLPAGTMTLHIEARRRR